MIVPDLLSLFVEPLERRALPYMITGGVASVIYGDARFTRDIDLVLDLGPGDIDRFLAAFDSEDMYVPPREVLTAEVRRRSGGHFNVIHRDTALRADVYLRGDDPLHAWAFERRRRIDVDEDAIWVAPPEYVILRKLQYYRDGGSDRHLRDVFMILRISVDQIDPDSLGEWLERLRLTAEFEAAESYEA